MIIEVKVPQLPESVSEASLATWKKQEGDYVQRDENLIDLETDKVALELPAPQAGILVAIVAQNGETVMADQVIARIDTSAQLGAKTPVETDSTTPASVIAAATDISSRSALDNLSSKASSILAMPAAAKLAEEMGVDLAHFSGSGRGGRILKEDVLAAPIAPKSIPSSPEPVFTPPPVMPMVAHVPSPAPIPTAVVSEPVLALPSSSVQSPAEKPVLAMPVSSDRERREPMSRLRQAVAGRLILSQQTNAILTTFNEVNMKPLLDLRAKYKEKFEKEHGVKLGIMSFFVKAAVYALKKYPLVNACIDGTDIVYHNYYDIGVAVGSARGLVVPILRDVEKLSLADIEKKIADFGKRAQEGRISLEEMSGGTYTITNGGTFGSLMSTPIINPPQSAILGMHATKERAVVEAGQIVARPMMYLAQSYDHRLIDGREAVLSLTAIKDVLEDPARMLLDV